MMADDLAPVITPPTDAAICACPCRCESPTSLDQGCGHLCQGCWHSGIGFQQLESAPDPVFRLFWTEHVSRRHRCEVCE